VLVNHSPPQSEWGRHAVSDVALEGVAAVVSVSELAVDTLPECRRSDPDSSVIWNAVDPSRLEPSRSRAAMRASWGVPEDTLVVGYYGRLSAEKRPDVLPSLAMALPSRFHVVAIGDGSNRDAVEAEAQKLGAANLHLPGRDPDAGSVLAAYDWLISPSEFESFGLSIAEALWEGLPVVSTPTGLPAVVPGLARMVGPMASGVEFALAITADEADATGRQARVASARDFARQRLAPDRLGREYGELFASLTRPKSPAVANATPRPRPRPSNGLDKVVACPDRGPVLPHSLQPEGCRCGELSECRAGRGKISGRVTLKDCLACVNSRN
jgi:glycosyltransferase involved in cell wall biosynthesis